MENTSGQGKTAIVPEEIKGWSWGAFLLGWIWAIGNKTWIGLLTLIPYLGWVMFIILGIKGREWAWKSKNWESIEHFQTVQKKWTQWGVGIIVVTFILGFLSAIIVPVLANITQ